MLRYILRTCAGIYLLSAAEGMLLPDQNGNINGSTSIITPPIISCNGNPTFI